MAEFTKLLPITSSSLALTLYFGATSFFALLGMYATIALPIADEWFLLLISVPLAVTMTIEAIGAFGRRRVLLAWRNRRGPLAVAGAKVP